MPSTINLTNATHLFEFYAVLIVSTIGFITNLMNIHVSSKIQKTSMGLYNILLSICNIIGIFFVNILNFFPQSIGEKELILTSDLACKLIPYFTRLFPQLHAWLNIMISFDRLILMSYGNLNAYKNRSPYLKDGKRIIQIALGLFLLICVLNLPGFLFQLKSLTQIDKVTNQTTISFQCASTPLIMLIRDLIPIIFRNVLPLIIQLAISAMLILKLSKLKINVNTLSLKREHKFTFTIVILNLIFIITDIMFIICFILLNIYGYNPTFVSTTSNESAIVSFVYLCILFGTVFAVFDLLFVVNLLTNRKFFKEARKMYWFKNTKVNSNESNNSDKNSI